MKSSPYFWLYVLWSKFHNRLAVRELFCVWARNSDAALATAVYFTSTLGSWDFDFQVWQFCLTNVNQEKDLKGKKDWFLLSLYLKERSKGEWREWRSMHGQSSYWTAKSSFIFLTSDHTEAENLGPKLHPRGGFFVHIKIYLMRGQTLFWVH